MVLNMISKNVGIIANSNREIGIITNSDREYWKPDFPILGNWVSNRDSSGVSPKSGFQSGPIRSDGISLKKLTRKSAKMPNPEILRSVPVFWSCCLAYGCLRMNGWGRFDPLSLRKTNDVWSLVDTTRLLSLWTRHCGPLHEN